MRKFDYSFVSNLQVPAETVSKMIRISALEKRLELLRARPCGSAEAAEYAFAFDAGADRTGYARCLALLPSYLQAGFCGETLRKLHGTLLSPSGNPGAGFFAPDDGLISEEDASGIRRVRFRPVRSAEIPSAVDAICSSYCSVLRRGAEPLILVPCAVTDLLCVSPFSTATPALSVLVLRLLLTAAGYPACPCMPLEKNMSEGKENFFSAVKLSSAGWSAGSGDYMPVIRALTDVLLAACEEADAALPRSIPARQGGENGKKKKGSRIESAVLDSERPLSKSEICAMLPDVSVSTVEAVLGKLCRNGMISMSGSGRSARYARTGSGDQGCPG